MDPRGIGPVSVQVNNTAAQLLASLCVQMETEDVNDVISRALGLLDLSIKTKSKGGRLCFINEHGDVSDVVV